MQPYFWQQLQWKRVISQCLEKRAPNAFLLAGPKGLGKMTFAMALSKWLLCEKPTEQACGMCRACHWTDNETHPDFFTLFSQESQIIKIDQVRLLIDQLAQTPVYARSQICLIAPVEAMNKAASNALLKTLEEPSGRVIFLLVSHYPSRLPLTLRSRAQMVSFSAPPVAVVKPWLEEQISQNKMNLTTDHLLAISGGLPLASLALATQENTMNGRHKLFEELTQLFRKQTHPVAAAEKLSAFEVSDLLQYWFSIVVDLMRLLMDVQDVYLLHPDKKEMLSFFAANVSLRSLVYYQHELRETLRNYHQHPNLNQTLLLEYLLIQWRKLCS